MCRIPIILMTLCAVGALALACSPPPKPSGPESVQPRCTLTYAAGIPAYVFTVGTDAMVQGSILADGECSGINQTLAEPLPDGPTFTVDWGGRRWAISGAPTTAMDQAAYTIIVRAELGSSGKRSTHKKIKLQVME